jgi:hypothetical protein
MFGFFDDSFGCTHGVLKDEIRKVRMFQRYRPQEHRLLDCANPQRQPAILFDR